MTLDSISHRLGVRIPGEVYEQILKVAIHHERASKLFSHREFKALVVATQHGAVIRAVIAAALRAPSRPRVLYIPHAPAATTSWYRDLPAHHALLRGSAEVDFYAATGARPAQLHVVGDPSFMMQEPHANLNGEGAVLLAPSFQDREGLVEMIRVVESTDPGPVELCPHPRARDQVSEIQLPPGWSITDSRYTGERLARGGIRALITNGSGVGLEALMYGVPVIDLGWPGASNPYCYAQSEFVTRVATPTELAHALMNTLTQDAPTRSRIQVYAESWIGNWGPKASRLAAAKLVDLAGQPVPAALALDRWSVPTST
jgi:hypothetical protein